MHTVEHDGFVLHFNSDLSGEAFIKADNGAVFYFPGALIEKIASRSLEELRDKCRVLENACVEHVNTYHMHREEIVSLRAKLEGVLAIENDHLFTDAIEALRRLVAAVEALQPAFGFYPPEALGSSRDVLTMAGIICTCGGHRERMRECPLHGRSKRRHYLGSGKRGSPGDETE